MPWRQALPIAEQATRSSFPSWNGLEWDSFGRYCQKFEESGLCPLEIILAEALCLPLRLILSA